MNFSALLRRLGRTEKLFLGIAILWLIWVAFFPTQLIRVALQGALIGVGGWLAIRYSIRGFQGLIWRLRNRLIAAYLFIAVVPFVLLVAFAQRSVESWSGQLCVYLAHSAFDRKVDTMHDQARGLLALPPVRRVEPAQQIAAVLGRIHPGLEMRVTGPAVDFKHPDELATPPVPAGWKDARGFVVRDGLLYAWTFVASEDSSVSMAFPVSRSFLTGLVPGLGEITLLSATAASVPMRPHRPETDEEPEPVRLPAENFLDSEVRWGGIVPVAMWEKPETYADGILGVRTRISQVFGLITSTKLKSDQTLQGYLYFFSGLFFIAEVVAYLIGLRITRTITGAVHDIYAGTEHVRDGDFSKRIPVKGSDQLADLSGSFNMMTERVQQLLEVEKEKQRMQAELQIAREVQAQLFPKQVPNLASIRMLAASNPARTVSGDYYDYRQIGAHQAAVVMGDVSGKGISAALLMATLAGSLRTEIRHGVERGNFSVVSIITELNKHLHAHTSPEKYATFCFGLIDEEADTFTYANGGHLPPILVRNGEARFLEVNGMVVGAFPFAKYEEDVLKLEQGDLLLFYTDGITEPENEYGEMYGEERLMQLLVKNASLSSEAIVDKIMAAVKGWLHEPDTQDDMTLLLVRRC